MSHKARCSNCGHYVLTGFAPSDWGSCEPCSRCGHSTWEAVVDDEPEVATLWVRITGGANYYSSTRWYAKHVGEVFRVRRFDINRYVVDDKDGRPDRYVCHSDCVVTPFPGELHGGASNRYIYKDDCELAEDPRETPIPCPGCVAKAFEILDAKDRNTRSTALINKVYEQLALKRERIQSLLEENGVLDTSLKAKTMQIEILELEAHSLERNLADKVDICEHLGKSVDCLKKQLATSNEVVQYKECRIIQAEDALKSCEARLHIKINCLEGMEANRNQFASDLDNARDEIKALKAGTFKLELDPATAKELFKVFPNLGKPAKKKAKPKTEKKLDSQ